MAVRLEVTDKRILNFYKAHPGIDFQTINLLFIDLIEKIDLNVQDGNIQSQLLNSIANMRDEITSLKETVISNNADVLKKTLAKFKEDYISEIYQIVQTNTHNHIAPSLRKTIVFLWNRPAALFTKSCLITMVLLPKFSKNSQALLITIPNSSLNLPTKHHCVISLTTSKLNPQ